MANSNRVFVSPGVYTSEKDLTFVAQSVGVTTLGLVGETLKGPAFEPILIGNFDEYKTYFGPTSPEKDGSGNPKYELGYVAKSYLQESNQLFVTRVLGLTGYKPGYSFGVKTIGGVIPTGTTWSNSLSGATTGLSWTGTTLSGVTGNTIYNELSDKTAIDGTSITDYILTNFSGNTNSDNNKWFVLGLVPLSGTTGQTSTLEVSSPLTGLKNSTNSNNKEWYNSLTNTLGTEVYSYKFVWNSGTTKFDVTRWTYASSVNSKYNDIIIAELRQRGLYSQQNLELEVTGNTISMTSTGLTSNPFSDITVTVPTPRGSSVSQSFTCNFNSASNKHISKVFGTDVFDKSKDEYPIYVHEIYDNLLKSAYEQGYIRGLSTTVTIVDRDDDFMKEWDTAKSPMVVSEVRGNTVADLFEVISISDGNSSNVEVKITIQNINLDTGEFDLLVRDFNDTDDNMVALEKFTRCSMNPDVAGYIARKIGTSDGEYSLNSKYIMLRMDDNAPSDAFPAGFKGFRTNSSFGGKKLGDVLYKTDFFDSGETIYYDSLGQIVTTTGDKYRKTSLGLSSQEGFKFDASLFKYKGDPNTATLDGSTYGFHLSSNASTITGSTSNGYLYQCTPYDLENQSGGDANKLTSINYRKFTLALCGGFDGWDIYRQTRTNTDEYVFGKSTYTSGNTTNLGLFGTSFGTANSDLYSYLKGIETFANPEAVNINVFATPGINFRDHSSLVTQAIDMVENDRADSIYIIGSPNESASANVISDLDEQGIDSNYSATYWPWIQIRDTDNATQLYIPPTGEVVRNIALTDNVSYPWFAVAGYSRGLVNAIKATKKLTLDERDELYKNRINPIATFSDTGTIIWGNKTLQVRESALDRINVRRLLLRARKLISAVAVRLLFEQNDDQVRQEFLRLVNPILEAIKKERGLYDFRVSVSNSPEDIDANTLRGKIYIKPTRSLEFIDLEFIITPTGASFENI